MKNLNPNKEFIIRFTANKRHFLGRYFRTLVKAKNLHNFIGEKNANTALSEALLCKDDKYTVRFRKFGRVEFFLK